MLESRADRRLFAGDLEAVFKEEWTGEAGLPGMVHKRRRLG
jgi:hypothetical protein